MRNLLVSSGLAWCSLLLGSACADAHAVGVDCFLRGDKVEVEAYYDDDTPARKARVEIVSARADVLVAGMTDDNGRWSCAAPAPGQYEVRIDAGAGHRAKSTITIPGRTESPAPGTSPEAQETRISNEPSRAEFTEVPWLKAAIGLVVIGGCAGAFLLASFLRRKSERDSV